MKHFQYTFLQIALNALRGGYKHIFFFMSDFRLGTIYKRFGLEFPDLSFHDSHHHLRATGRRIRTERLIGDLCASPLIKCCGTP